MLQTSNPTPTPFHAPNIFTENTTVFASTISETLNIVLPPLKWSQGGDKMVRCLVWKNMIY